MQVIGQMRSKLHLNCSPVQIPIGLEHEHRGLVDLLHMKAYDFQGKFGETISEVTCDLPPRNGNTWTSGRRVKMTGR
jgi:elongation factor G